VRRVWVALWLCACHHSPVADGGFVDVTVAAQTSSGAITRVSVAVSPANLSADLTRDPSGTFSGTLAVSPGSQTVTATAWAGMTQVGSGSGSPGGGGPDGAVSIAVPDGRVRRRARSSR
jgi:hypothetical protein